MIVINSSASKRTKDRVKMLREDPEMEYRDLSKSCPSLGGIPALLFASKRWTGWLPMSEIEWDNDWKV